jgi:hypothetical protein
MRQHDDHSIRQSLRRLSIADTDGLGGSDMAPLPSHRHSSTSVVCALRNESRRSSISSNGDPTGMEVIPLDLPPDQSIVGSPHSGSVCLPVEQSTTAFHDMETASTSDGHERYDAQLATIGELLPMPTVELNPIHPTEDSPGTDYSHTSDPVLAVSDMVSRPPSPVHPETNSDTSVRSTDRRRRRSTSDVQERPVVFDRLASKRRRLEAQDVSEDAVAVILDPARQHSRSQSYSHIQSRFRQWAISNNLDPDNPNPITIINFLADGHTRLRWSASTVLTYRSALLDLYADPGTITSNVVFQDFFRAVKDTSIRPPSLPVVDILPIVTELRVWGDNISMTPAQLTHKLCWLLSLCGFLRPSDIARIQDDRTVINAGTLTISILAPKEKRGGQRITRTVLI